MKGLKTRAGRGVGKGPKGKGDIQENAENADRPPRKPPFKRKRSIATADSSAPTYRQLLGALAVVVAVFVLALRITSSPSMQPHRDEPSSGGHGHGVRKTQPSKPTATTGVLAACERVDGNWTQEQFQLHQKRHGRVPVVMTAQSTWRGPNPEQWQEQEFLRAYGRLKLTTTATRHQIELGNFWDGSHKLGDAVRSYDQAFTEAEFSTAELISEMRGKWEVPVAMQGPDGIRGSSILSVGRSNQGSVFHKHAANYLVLLAGQKTWWLVEPDGNGTPLAKTDPGLTHTNPCTFDEKPPQLSKAQRHRKILRCEHRVGEAIYLPEGWWHATCNRDTFNLGAGAVGVVTGWDAVVEAARDGDVVRAHPHPPPPILLRCSLRYMYGVYMIMSVHNSLAH